MHTTLVAIRIGGCHLRLIRTDTDLVVTRTTPRIEVDSVAISRQRFSADDGVAAATAMLSAATECAGGECRKLRASAEHAARRCAHARETLRPRSEAMRSIERDTGAAISRYLADGCAFVDQMLDLERRLLAAGFTVADLGLPDWMTVVLRDLDQNGGSSSDQVAGTAGSPSSAPGSRSLAGGDAKM